MSREERTAYYGVTTGSGKMLLVRKNRPGEPLKELERKLFRSTTFHVNHVVRARKVLRKLREEMGETSTKEIRFMVALKHGGFKQVGKTGVGLVDVLKGLGVHLSVNGRSVVLTQNGNIQSFTDDFYWSGLRFILSEVLEATQVAFPYVDQRDMHSVKKLSGQQDPKAYLRQLLDNDQYHCPQTRFYGGSGLTGLWRVVVKGRGVVAVREVDVARKRLHQMAQFLVLNPEDLVRALEETSASLNSAAAKLAVKRERDEVAKWFNLLGGTLTADVVRTMLVNGIMKRAIISYWLCRRNSGNLSRRVHWLYPFRDRPV